MDDTPSTIYQKMHEMIQTKSATERFKMGWSMYETSKFLIIHSILQTSPNISKSALRQEIFLKFYGTDFDPLKREKILKHLENIPESCQ